MGEIAQTFNWFTQKIDALEAHNRALEQERDRLEMHQADTAKLTALEAENTQLQQALKQSKEQLEGTYGAKVTALEAEKTQLEKALGEAKQQLEAIYQVLGQPVPSRNGTAVAATPTPAPAPTPAPPPAPKAVTAPNPQRDRSDSKAKMEAIVQDLINWNTAQPSNDTRLRISVSILKALGLLVGATYQPVIMEVLKEQEAAIEEHHRQFMLGVRHNVSVDKDTVLKAIARDYMGVENWQAATY